MIKLIPVSVVAGRLGCSVSSVYRLISSGEITCFRVGPKKGYMIDQADLACYLARRASTNQWQVERVDFFGDQ